MFQGGDAISVQTFTTTYAGYSWYYKKPFKLTGYADKVTYKNRNDALTACAATKKCLGVTKEKKKKFRLNTSATARPAKGMAIWIQGGAITKEGTVENGVKGSHIFKPRKNIFGT